MVIESFIPWVTEEDPTYVNIFPEELVEERLMLNKGSAAQVPPGFLLEMWASDESRENNDETYSIEGKMREDGMGVEC